MGLDDWFMFWLIISIGLIAINYKLTGGKGKIHIFEILKLSLLCAIYEKIGEK